MAIKILYYKTFSFLLLSSHSVVVVFICYLTACSLRHGNTYRTSADLHRCPRTPPAILCIWPTNSRICLPIAARCRPQPGAWKSSPLPMAPLPQSMVDGQLPRDHNIHTRMPLVPGWEVGKRLSPISSPTKYTMELPAQGKSAYHFALLPDAMRHKLTMNLPCLLTCHYLGQRMMVECYPQHPQSPPCQPKLVAASNRGL